MPRADFRSGHLYNYLFFFAVTFGRARAALACAGVISIVFCGTGTRLGATDALFTTLVANYHKGDSTAHDKGNNAYN